MCTHVSVFSEHSSSMVYYCIRGGWYRSGSVLTGHKYVLQGLLETARKGVVSLNICHQASCGFLHTQWNHVMFPDCQYDMT